jgi:hypothetical protein
MTALLVALVGIVLALLALGVGIARWVKEAQR